MAGVVESQTQVCPRGRHTGRPAAYAAMMARATRSFQNCADRAAAGLRNCGVCAETERDLHERWFVPDRAAEEGGRRGIRLCRAG